MKAADIPDELFLSIVAHYNFGEAENRVVESPVFDPILIAGPRWCLIWDLEEWLDFPTKVIRAKADKLIRRGLLEGCACGCRGDFELPEVSPFRRNTNGGQISQLIARNLLTP